MHFWLKCRDVPVFCNCVRISIALRRLHLFRRISRALANDATDATRHRNCYNAIFQWRGHCWNGRVWAPFRQHLVVERRTCLVDRVRLPQPCVLLLIQRFVQFQVCNLADHFFAFFLCALLCGEVFAKADGKGVVELLRWQGANGMLGITVEEKNSGTDIAALMEEEVPLARLRLLCRGDTRIAARSQHYLEGNSTRERQAELVREVGFA